MTDEIRTKRLLARARSLAKAELRRQQAAAMAKELNALGENVKLLSLVQRPVKSPEGVKYQVRMRVRIDGRTIVLTGYGEDTYESILEACRFHRGVDDGVDEIPF